MNVGSVFVRSVVLLLEGFILCFDALLVFWFAYYASFGFLYTHYLLHVEEL